LSQDREEAPWFDQEAEVCDLQVNTTIEIHHTVL
jgi:hypothetical protein